MDLILGDSHTRSFSYHPKLIAIFIAPGKDLLLLEKEGCDKVIRKLKENAGLFGAVDRVVVLLGEASIRWGIEAEMSEQEVCDGLCASLVRISTELADSTGREVIVMPPVPRANDLSYIRVWNMVVGVLKRDKVLSANASIFDSAVDENGALLDRYIGDYIHANHLLADCLDRHLGYDAAGIVAGWPYGLDVSGGARIWGGVPESNLRYSGTAQRDWGRLNLTTIEFKRLVRVIERLQRLSTVFFRSQAGLSINFFDGGLFLKEASMVPYYSNLNDTDTRRLSALGGSSFKSEETCPSIFVERTRVLKDKSFCDLYKVTLCTAVDQRNPQMARGFKIRLRNIEAHFELPIKYMWVPILWKASLTLSFVKSYLLKALTKRKL